MRQMTNPRTENVRKMRQAFDDLYTEFGEGMPLKKFRAEATAAYKRANPDSGDAPKRKNNYMIFMSENLPAVRENNPDKTYQEQRAIVTAMWNSRQASRGNAASEELEIISSDDVEEVIPPTQDDDLNDLYDHLFGGAGPSSVAQPSMTTVAPPTPAPKPKTPKTQKLRAEKEKEPAAAAATEDKTPKTQKLRAEKEKEKEPAAAATEDKTPKTQKLRAEKEKGKEPAAAATEDKTPKTPKTQKLRAEKEKGKEPAAAAAAATENMAPSLAPTRRSTRITAIEKP